MIIIPQLFNYRLIIGSLVIVIIVLGSYSFVSFNTLKEQTEFLENEQKLMETELSQMLRLYDDLETKNNNLNAQLEESKQTAQSTLDSLRILKANEAVISKYKSQIIRLRQERIQLEQQLDKLGVENEPVQAENTNTTNEPVSHKVTSVDSKELPSLAVDNFDAKALKILKSGKNIETSTAKKVNRLEVCFGLTNVFKTEDLFIQILNPKNNVIADKGEANFGNSSLIYSKKMSVDQWSAKQTICTEIESDNEQYIKGVYFVNIFNNQKLLANTTLELN